MKNKLDTAIQILNSFEQNGFQAYIVGGYVRDSLLHISSEDIDITTDARPDQVTDLFDRVIHTGVKFGTVTIFLNGFHYEVTTFRSEGKYSDNRHPDEIKYSDMLEEDLIRRDFTINAMVINKDGDLIDLFHGKQDLEQKCIRAIGDPVQRFEEDVLRILRAFRFVSKLDFTIEEQTIQAIRQTNKHLTELPMERIQSELHQIFSNPFSKKAIGYLVLTNSHKYLPGLKEGLEYINNHVSSLQFMEYWALCFTLYNGIHPDWKFSNKFRSTIERILECASKARESGWDEYLVFSYQLEISLMANHVNVALGYTQDYESRIKEIEQNLVIKEDIELDISGNDILGLFHREAGPWVHLLRGQLIKAVVYKKVKNELEHLTKYANALMDKLDTEEVLDEDK